MRCEQFETRLNDILDRRGDPGRDGSLTAHSARCARCRRTAESYSVLIDGLRQWQEDAAGRPPVRSHVGTNAGRRGMAFAAFAVAAGLMLAVVLHRRPPADAPESPADIAALTVPQTPIDTKPGVSEPPLPLRPVVSGIGGRPIVIDFAKQTGLAYVELVDGTARGVDEVIIAASTLPPPTEFLEPVLFPEDGLWKRIGTDFVPRAGETFDAIRNALPVEFSRRSSS
jgi:hypothetical protein